MRAALAPSARVSGSAWLRRRLARLFTGRDLIARGTSDFILTTLARSRPQQVPIAICAAIAVGIISVSVSMQAGSLSSLQSPRTVVLWIPLVIGYWIIVGLRSSFFMPTELPAAWAFRAHARLPSSSYWSGVRASIVAFAVVPALAANAIVVLPLLGWNGRGVAHDFCMPRCDDCRAMRVHLHRQRTVYACLSAGSHENQNSLAAVFRWNVCGCLLACSMGTSNAIRAHIDAATGCSGARRHWHT